MIISNSGLVRKDDRRYEPQDFIKAYLNWQVESRYKRLGPAKRFRYDDDWVLGKSLRHIVFAKSLNCHICGLRGQFFVKEQEHCLLSIDSWTMNLYGVNNRGDEILMTVDHIYDRSNHPSNLKTCCLLCNNARGNIPYSELFKPRAVKTMREIRKRIINGYAQKERRSKTL